jgi:hypothetical protein
MQVGGPAVSKSVRTDSSSESCGFWGSSGFIQTGLGKIRWAEYWAQIAVDSSVDY